MNDTTLIEQQDARRADWKRRQVLQPSRGTVVVPSMGTRINRLNPSERHELRVMVKSLYLRKAIRTALAEAFWLGAPQKPLMLPSSSTERFQKTARSLSSLEQYERSLTPSSRNTMIEPEYTRVTYGPGLDPPAVKRALEQSLQPIGANE